MPCSARHTPFVREKSMLRSILSVAAEANAARLVSSKISFIVRQGNQSHS
jgi:hypothetical protein